MTTPAMRSTIRQLIAAPATTWVECPTGEDALKMLVQFKAGLRDGGCEHARVVRVQDDARHPRGAPRRARDLCHEPRPAGLPPRRV